MAKLSGRLRQLRELRDRGGQGDSHGPGVPPKAKQEPCGRSDTTGSGDRCEELLQDWEQLDPYVWKKRSVLPLSSREVKLTGLLLDDREDLRRLTFYDFETTGLSGGAGTLIFLAGFGVLKSLPEEEASPGGSLLEVEQLLLTDYPGESAFLHRLLPFLGSERIFVSYNGKSFDRSILQNRFRINGIREDMPGQLDLLYPARRLWGRVLEGCSLQQVERDILGIFRSGDIGGALIPQCYQDFLRGEELQCMRGVIEHHLRDIHSLGELLFLLESLPAARIAPGHTCRGRRIRAEEKTGIGVLLLRKSVPGALFFLEAALEEGDDQAGKHLVLHYKRNRKYGELERVLKRMLELRRGFFQIVEMAKLFEHYHHRPDLALDILSSLPAPGASLTKAQYTSFVYRKQRLTGKIASCYRISSS